MLDRDSTEISVYGQQENSACNGHFESSCFHPLLLPEIERQRKLGKEVVFRADAAFAKPEIYEARLWLSVISYKRGNLWRRLVLPKRIENWSLTSSGW